MEHRAHPSFVLPDIAQNPHVTLMIDIDAECMLRFSLPLEEIGSTKQIPDIQTDAVVVSTRQALDIGGFEDAVQRLIGSGRWKLLEERITVQPRITLPV